MLRLRAGLILLVAVLYGAAPMAADACARACASATPACHHTASPSAHIGHAPDICDYAHDSVSQPFPGPSHAMAAVPAGTPQALPQDIREVHRHGLRAAGSPPIVPLPSIPLRI